MVELLLKLLVERNILDGADVLKALMQQADLHGATESAHRPGLRQIDAIAGNLIRTFATHEFDEAHKRDRALAILELDAARRAAVQGDAEQ